MNALGIDHADESLLLHLYSISMYVAKYVMLRSISIYLRGGLTIVKHQEFSIKGRRFSPNKSINKRPLTRAIERETSKEIIFYLYGDPASLLQLANKCA